MKGLFRNVFGGNADKDKGEAKAASGGEAEKAAYQNQEQVNAQKPEESKQENAQMSFTSSTGFNLPGLSVNQSYVQPSISGPTNSDTGAEGQALSQSQTTSSNQLPGLFAGMFTPEDAAKDAINNQKEQEQSNHEGFTILSQSQALPSNSLPGLFAGLGQPVPSTSATGEQAKDASREAPVNDSTAAASAFDFFGQMDVTNQGNHQSQNKQADTQLQGNTHAYAASNSSGLGAFASILDPPPSASRALGMQPAATASGEQDKSDPTQGAFGGLFAGLASSPGLKPYATPSSENQTMAQPAYMTAAAPSLPSAFDFMAGAGQGAGQPMQSASNMQAASKVEEQKPVEGASSGLSGLGLFAGMDLLAGSANANTGSVTGMEANGNAQSPGMQVIHEQSFEAVSRDMAGLASPGLKDGRQNMGTLNQQEEYQPPSLLQMAEDVSGASSKAEEPQGQPSLFAFMSVKQADGAARFHLPSQPDIQPSHPSQLQSNEQLSAHDRDNEPFNAQDIDREDLFTMPSSHTGGDLAGSMMGNKAESEEQERFEEILENREIIEDKIFAIKCRIVDLTVRQWDVSEKIKALYSDIEILSTKVEETQNEQAQAIEAEDYEKADSLDMRIKQTKKLVEAKEYQIKQLRENKLSQEVMKADKHQELSELMHRSIGKVDAIKEKQEQEMKQYKEAEVVTIEEKRSGLHDESVRIGEEKKVLEEEKGEVDGAIAQIDEQVYQDTKEEHAEKHKLDEMIDDLNREVEELMRVLERKKKEREMLQLEKQVHERKIEQARMMYKDELSTRETKLDEVTQKLNQNSGENSQWEQDQNDLQEYELNYNNQMQNFDQEFKNLEELKNYLEMNSVEIDQCNKERKEIRIKQNGIEAQVQQLTESKRQIVQGREFIQERLAKLEQELDEFESQSQSHQQKLTKLEQEKKKFATAKKFKDAGKCQTEMKELQQQMEYCSQQIQKTKDHKEQIDKDLEDKEKEEGEINQQLSEVQVENEKTQLIMFTYRKDEIMDLIGSINRVLDQAPAKGEEIQRKDQGAGRKKIPNDLEAKRDKMQNELNSIDEELFELEKKYGEYKRPEIKRVVAPVEEEKEEDTKEEEIVEVKIERPIVATEEIVKTKEEQVPQEEKVEEQTEPVVQKEEEPAAQFDAATLNSMIKEYESKCQQLEELMDKAAEDENYDEAEKLQEELEKHQSQNEANTEHYRTQLIQVESGDLSIPQYDNVENNQGENNRNEAEHIPEATKQESEVKVADNEVNESNPVDAPEAVAPEVNETQAPQSSMFSFMQSQEENKEEEKVEQNDENNETKANENTEKNQVDEDKTTKVEEKTSAFGFMSSAPEQTVAAVAGEMTENKEERDENDTLRKQYTPESESGELAFTKYQSYAFELEHSNPQGQVADTMISVSSQDKSQHKEEKIVELQAQVSMHSMTSDIIQNLVDDPEQDEDNANGAAENNLDTQDIQIHSEPQTSNDQPETQSDEQKEEPAIEQEQYQPPTSSGFAFMQTSVSSTQAAAQSETKPEEPEEKKEEEEVAAPEQPAAPGGMSAFSFMSSMPAPENNETNNNEQKQEETAEEQQQQNDQPAQPVSGFGFMNN